MDIVLVGGLWLTGSAWDLVVPELTALGHRAIPVTLPVSPGATLEDQVDAVVAAVDAADGESFVVGHSAASALAWLAADRRPEQVAKVGMIGGFPKGDGETYADFFPAADGVMAWPGWEPFEGADARDLDAEARRAFEAATVPVPETVSKAIVRLGDERRYDVPVLLICPEFSPDEARQWVKDGDVPELAKAKHVEYADVDSGHWPMTTQPAELARVLADAAS